MIPKSELKKLVKEHGTPLFVVDHDEIRRNYAEFRKRLPRVQAYYAVKANPDPAIVETLYKRGPASTWPRCPSSRSSTSTSRTCRPRSGRTSSGTRSSTPIPIKANETLRELDQYKPLVTYDNFEEIPQGSQARPARRFGPAAARAQHGGHGRAVVEVRRGLRRGRGTDRGRPRRGPGRRGAQFPRRQPDARISRTTCRRCTWRRACSTRRPTAATR